MKKRLCRKCDDMVTGNPCPACGADTERWPVENPREKGDDDGLEYGHPGDRLKGID